ncbi:MAG: SGNH/GDSL hydrolase family protein [Lachnospiraceae bacterium]|nr:SGNH/GDSL hydrolase family protein [Lachnospiraceae bacterium]
MIYYNGKRRLSDFLKKCGEGNDLAIAFIGGSITQGAAASDDGLCYAAGVYKWFRQKYPLSGFKYINAGIGATTSQFGAARVCEDVLKYSPDLVFIEYGVNDNDEAPFERRELFREAYEGLLRKVLSSGSKPAVILIHNVRYDDGSSEEDMHSGLGEYYDLPSVSVGRIIYDRIKTGSLNAADITPDNLHPNDRGHKLAAQIITEAIETLENGISYMNTAPLKRTETGEIPDGDILPPPLTANDYEEINRFNNLNLSPQTDGFTADTTGQEKREGMPLVRDVFKNGWYAYLSGASITFTVYGGELCVMYKKTIKRPAPAAKAIIDDDEENAVILDANFNETWGDKAYMATLLHHGEDKEHKLEIILTETADNPFYLINVIAKKVK